MIRKFPLLLVTSCLVGLLAACQPQPPELHIADPPTGPDARLPNWCRFHNGMPCLSWVEPRADGHVLKLAWLENGEWSEPLEVAQGNDWFVNWADFPSVIELPSGDLVAHWLERSGPGRFHYDIRLSRSGDGGETWLAPVTPHLDGTLTEHGFVSLFPATDDRVGLVWLDGRYMVADDPASSATGDGHAGGGHGSGTGPMTLRTVLADQELGLTAKAELDGRVCECCQTSVAQADDGLIAVYRGRDEDETRDIRTLRHDRQGWTEPGTVHADGWVIPGCPVNGPAVAALENRVAVAWFTGAEPHARVQLAYSDDGGRRFSDPVEIAGEQVLGHVDVVMAGPDELVTSWLASGTGGRAELYVRAYSLPGLEPGPPRRVATVGHGRSAGFPRMVAAGGQVHIAWTRARDESYSVHAARVIVR